VFLDNSNKYKFINSPKYIATSINKHLLNKTKYFTIN